MKKKTVKIIGLLLSLALIVAGIVIISQDAEWHHFRSGRTTEVQYGADFYTDIFDATNSIAHNTYSVEETLLSMFDLLKLSFGLAFIFAGLFSALHFVKAEAPSRKEDDAPAAKEATAEGGEAVEETSSETTEVLTE